MRESVSKPNDGNNKLQRVEGNGGITLTYTHACAHTETYTHKHTTQRDRGTERDRDRKTDRQREETERN